MLDECIIIVIISVTRYEFGYCINCWLHVLFTIFMIAKMNTFSSIDNIKIAYKFILKPDDKENRPEI